MTRASVFHIVAAPDWDSALAGGSYTPESLVTEGFVHLSGEHQVTGVANEHYRDGCDLVVVELDPDLLGRDLVEEDLCGKGETFPHLYGPVPTSATVAVHPLPRIDDGSYRFPG